MFYEALEEAEMQAVTTVNPSPAIDSVAPWAVVEALGFCIYRLSESMGKNTRNLPRCWKLSICLVVATLISLTDACLVKPTV